MPKKRLTKKEKIILQLKRELARRQSETLIPKAGIKPRQEAISQPKPKITLKPKKVEKLDKSIFFYNPRYAKKDLLKSLILTVLILATEFVLYWKLG